MVLLTLLGLTALLQTEWKEVKKSDESDGLVLTGSTNGKTSQHITSDPEVLHTEEEPTNPPKIDDNSDLVSERSEVLYALNSVKILNIPQVPVNVVSDCRADIPQASDNPTEDTVAPQSSQLKDNDKTMDINACSDEISIQQNEVLGSIHLDDGLQEGYFEPLQLELQHQHSEGKERDGASDIETEEEPDSGVPEVYIPTDDTPDVLNKVISGLSLRLKDWWEIFLWEILIPAMISIFFFMIIVNLGPAVLLMTMMLSFQIKGFHQIITTGYRVYCCYHMPWFRTLSLYFLLCVSYLFYGEMITDYLFTLVQREQSVHMLSKYHQFISLALYLVWICMVVLSLVKKSHRLPFCMFVWTHLTLVIMAIHIDVVIQTLFEERILFITHIICLVCNYIIDYMFGFFVSDSP